jgi:hypothetical protein
MLTMLIEQYIPHSWFAKGTLHNYSMRWCADCHWTISCLLLRCRGGMTVKERSGPWQKNIRKRSRACKRTYFCGRCALLDDSCNGGTWTWLSKFSTILQILSSTMFNIGKLAKAYINLYESELNGYISTYQTHEMNWWIYLTGDFEAPISCSISPGNEARLGDTWPWRFRWSASIARGDKAGWSGWSTVGQLGYPSTDYLVTWIDLDLILEWIQNCKLYREIWW